MWKNKFSINSTVPNQNFLAATYMIVLEPHPAPKKNWNDLSVLSTLSIRPSNSHGKSLKPQSLFSISTFLSKTTNWQPVSTTNPQIRTVTYCTRLPTHLKSKTRFRTPNFSPIFPNLPLVSFKRDRNLRNSLVRSSLPSNLEPGTFNCSRKVCNTCPFINSKTHIRGPNGSYQVNDHFDCTTSNIIYCITCTLCNKLYIGESGRKLGDRFREHLLDVRNKGSDLSKPVAGHFNLPGHSHEHMEICGIYLHLGNNETGKRKEQRLIFKLGTLAPNGINGRFSFA